MTAIVFGATGMVGSCILSQLESAGRRPTAVSRENRAMGASSDWVVGDLLSPGKIALPLSDVIHCAVDVPLFAKALPALIHRAPTRRVAVISSSSVRTKINSLDASERASMQELVRAERSIIATCANAGISWTILRPTLIYREGIDHNVTRLAEFICRFGFVPLCGKACGLRQPVHAEDLAAGAITASQNERAANNVYYVGGSEVISYREMVGRIFDALGKKRLMISLPGPIWQLALMAASPFLPGITGMMGRRMMVDLVVDASEAERDFGWKARNFAPKFHSNKRPDMRVRP
jgi:uncharacterized protein YbjT (DUF2867 family)